MVSDCYFKARAFAALRGEYEDAHREVEEADRRMGALQIKLDTWNTAVGQRERDLYYLDSDIQKLGESRKELERELDFTKDDDPRQQKIKYEIRDLDVAITEKRREQQRMHSDLDRLKNDIDVALYERRDEDSRKQTNARKCERIRPDLEDKAREGRQHCPEEYRKGNFDLPRW